MPNSAVSNSLFSSSTGATLGRRATTQRARFEDFGGTRRAFAAHEVVYYEGDPVKRLFQLSEGSLMLYKLLPDGRRQVVEVLQAGDIFGLAEGSEYDCTAETLTKTSVYEIDLKKVESSVGLQQQLTKCLIGQMNALHEHAMLLGRKSATERVASFFMYLIPNRGGPGCVGPDPEVEGDGCDLELHMTRQEIADYLGLTIETVSRVISDLKKRQVIRLEKSDRIHLRRVCDMCQITGIH
ncbi:helix-turn-helix domain-containing protein [Roseibium sp. CAU 1637]|uniref:Helix-turn-helix domain-containing protein n=1 Tax=Roseibium limicola TaxID=2816037 RepID=A0A939EQU7_9HYPH|nr:cyclic nucleotide-binding domain-containing protein [Roseibium limicola]MBO0345409.1 helix-turn-helix domain-containing protein [Roseibium limicola]